MADNQEEYNLNIEDESTEHGKIHASWVFPEFSVTKRSRLWYIFASLIAGGAIVLLLLQANPLFAVFIMLVVIIYVVRQKQQPTTIVVSITEDGIEIGERFYSYDDLKEFWIAYEPPKVKRLYVRFRNAVRANLSIPLEDQNPVVIREFLLQYIEEDLEQRGESVSDAFQRFMKLQ
ncbi:hypothetical protein ACFL0L_01200 [Patescibacteria group bacterium]